MRCCHLLEAVPLKVGPKDKQPLGAEFMLHYIVCNLLKAQHIQKITRPWWPQQHLVSNFNGIKRCLVCQLNLSTPCCSHILYSECNPLSRHAISWATSPVVVKNTCHLPSHFFQLHGNLLFYT